VLIDGEMVTRNKGNPVLNPATEEVVSEVPEADEALVNAAVTAAARAQPPITPNGAAATS